MIINRTKRWNRKDYGGIWLEVSGHRASQSLGFVFPESSQWLSKNSQEIHHVVLCLAGSNLCKHSSMAMMNMAALLMELPSFWIGNHRKV
jgi:hypothetical protein